MRSDGDDYIYVPGACGAILYGVARNYFVFAVIILFAGNVAGIG